MTTQEEHIITAKEPALTEQRFRPGDDGEPEEISDTREIHPLDGGPLPKYTCSCGVEFHRWAKVETHCEEAARGRIIQTRQISDDQVTLDEI